MRASVGCWAASEGVTVTGLLQVKGFLHRASGVAVKYPQVLSSLLPYDSFFHWCLSLQQQSTQENKDVVSTSLIRFIHPANKMTNWFAQSNKYNYNWIYCTLRRFIKYEDEIWKSDVRVVTLETQKEHVKSVMPTVLIEEGNIDRKIQKSCQNFKKPRSHVLCAKVKDHMAPQLLSGFSNKDIFLLEASHKVLFLLLLIKVPKSIAMKTALDQ